MRDDDSVGHAFISYVREDKDAIKTISSALAAADVPVWTDKAKLTPGQDWKVVIRKAIQRNALAFIAVFSSNSQARDQSYQNEELILAAEQFRQHPPGRVWLIPVRLDECELPEFDLGAGRTLNSLQRVDLFGEDAEDDKIRLVSAVLRILSESSLDSATVKALVSQSDQEHRGPTLSNAVKAMVLEPSRRIELEDLIVSEAIRAKEAISDTERFPESVALSNDVDTARRMVGRFGAYWTAVEPLAHAMVTGCAWAEADQTDVWTRAVRTVASVLDGPKSGNTYLLGMQAYPIMALVYAGALGAKARNNYATLRAVATEPIVRENNERVPVVNGMTQHDFESPIKAASNLLAFTAEGKEVEDDVIAGWIQRGGVRHTPVSDHLHALLQPLLKPLVPDANDYDDLFDEVEVLLPVLAMDGYLQAREAGRYVSRGWFGRFTWRYRHSDSPIHRRLQAECEAAGSRWEPLNAGLFGGSSERAVAAFEAFGELADQVMRNRW